MQIKLFIKLDKTNEILPNIKKRQSYYPIDDILKICLDNKLTDICVYLYQIKGDNKTAFELIKNDLIDNFNLALEKKIMKKKKKNILKNILKYYQHVLKYVKIIQIQLIELEKFLKNK